MMIYHLLLLLLIAWGCEKDFDKPKETSIIPKGTLIDENFNVPISNFPITFIGADTFYLIHTDTLGQFDKSNFRSGEYSAYLDYLGLKKTITNLSTNSEEWILNGKYYCQARLMITDYEDSLSTDVEVKQYRESYLHQKFTGDEILIYLRPSAYYSFLLTSSDKRFFSKEHVIKVSDPGESHTITTKFNTLSDFYPLKIGNKWSYKESTFNGYLMEGSQTRSFQTSEEVIRDTIVESTEKEYKVISYSGNRLSSIRVDDVEKKIYRLHSDGNEFLELDFSSAKTEVQEVLGIQLNVLVWSNSSGDVYSTSNSIGLAEGIGLIYDNSANAFSAYSRKKELTSAFINGIDY